MAEIEKSQPRACSSLPSSLHICSFPGCSKTFSRPDRLKIHLRSHTGERPFCCEEDGCTKQYARASHLKRHHEKSHQKQPSPTKIRCKEEDCKELFSSYSNLKKHIIRIHESRPYKCTYTGCGKAFRKHQHLKVHEFDHTHVNPFVCPMEGCGMSFRFPSVLKRHSKVHEGYPCDVEGCTEVMKTWTLLIKHKQLHHSKVFTCKECGSIFRKSNIYHQHMKTHSPERLLFSCPRDGCERSYLDKRNLMAHIRSFHDGQKFTCEQCQKQFSAKQKLHQHKKTHDPLFCKPKPKVRLNTHRKKSKLEKLTGYKRETCVGELSETVMVEDRNSLERTSYSDSCHSSQESLLAMDSSNPGNHVTVNDSGTCEEDMIVTGSPVDMCRGGPGPSHTQSSSESSSPEDMDSSAGPSKSSSVPNSVVCSPQESHQVQHKCR